MSVPTPAISSGSAPTPAAAPSSAAPSSTPPRFSIPPIHDNPDGWGPSNTFVPEKYRDLPYYPFVKSDKFGRIADFTGQQQFVQRGQRYPQQQAIQTMFNYHHVNDDESFTMVDAKPPKIRSYQRGRPPRPQQRRGGAVGGGAGGGAAGGGFQQSGRGKQRYGGGAGRGGAGGRSQGGWGAMNRRDDALRAKREASIEVRPQWVLVSETDLPPLARVAAAAYHRPEPESEELLTCGELAYYDAEYDRVTTKGERSLEHAAVHVPQVGSQADPHLKRFAEQQSSGGSAARVTVYTTGGILAQLMASPRSVYPWDLEIRKRGSQLWLDRSADYSAVEAVTVNETAHEPQQNDLSLDPINLPEALTKEATQINADFAQQVLQQHSNEVLAFDEPSPFSGSSSASSDADASASVAYRYRSFSVNNFTVVARFELDAAQKTAKGEHELLLVRALNEWDSKSSADYRKSLDAQRGAVLATEIKNNSAKLFKWTVLALLSGADALKLGYVSRHQPKSVAAHVVLGVQSYRPRELATLVGVSASSCWAVAVHYLNVLAKLPDGRYVLLKDPNKAVVRIYEVPAVVEKDGGASASATAPMAAASSSSSASSTEPVEKK